MTFHVMQYAWFQTEIWLAATDTHICSIAFSRQSLLHPYQNEFRQLKVINEPNSVLNRLVKMLDAYFSGKPESFPIPYIFFNGTEFQHHVWRAVRRIPFGQTITYGELARQIGRPKAVRAVGAANGANPLPIVIPCHRVIQSDGRLGGYAGGVDIKDELLRLEGCVI